MPTCWPSSKPQVAVPAPLTFWVRSHRTTLPLRRSVSRNP
jgi:hypothetical protein